MPPQSTLSLNSLKAEPEFLTIGALAKLCGVTVRTLRYYEEMDLIGPVKRSSGKYRLYSHHALKRVNAILALQGLNFSLEEILAVLGPFSKSKTYSKSQQIEHTRHSLAQQQQLIEDRIRQLDLLNQEIQKRRQVLESVCLSCQECTPEAQCAENCDYLEVHQ